MNPIKKINQKIQAKAMKIESHINIRQLIKKAADKKMNRVNGISFLVKFFS